MAPAKQQRNTMATADLAEMAAPYNPRRISDAELESLTRSMKFFGVVQPIIVNDRSGHIVGGHQRVKAAEAAGIDKLPVVHVDLDDPSEKQLNLALNRISGEWDDELLSEVILGLNADGADLALTGFDDEDLALILAGWHSDHEAVEKIDPHTDGITATVFVECAQEDKERVVGVIAAQLEEAGVVGYKVR